MFDTNHYIISRSYASPIGDEVLSWQILDMFFTLLEGKKMKYNELIFNDGKIKIEWCDRWDVLDDYYFIRIMPTDRIPKNVLSSRSASFQERLSKSNIKPYNFRITMCRSHKKRSGLFDKFAKKENETDLDFEYKIIGACLAMFPVIRELPECCNAQPLT